MRAAYTWSRSMDDGSGLFSFSQPYGLDGGQFIAQFPEGNRSLSSFDRPHVLSIAAQYTTGGPRWARGLDIAGVLNARSGLPDTIIQTNLHPDAGQQRPGVINGNVGGYATGRMIEGTAVRYLLPTTAATFPFVPVGPLFSGSGAGRIMVLGFGQPGNLGRNTTREPGEFNVDLSIARRIVLSRHSGLTLRVEAFNAFNRVNLNGPDTTLNVIVDPVTGQAAFNAPNFGLITTAKPPRTIQLALRVDF